MTENPKATLFFSGKALSRGLQWASGLAAGVVLFLIPVVVLLSQDMLPGFSSANSGSAIATSPLTVIVILALMVLILAALFRFFGNLRAVIASAEGGDPFTPENADRLTAMAWLFLGIKILALLVGGLRLHLANRIDGGANGGDTLDVSLYDLDAVVIVVTLFILARIFRHGTDMREDLEGTI